MANLSYYYNHTAKLLLAQEVDLANLKAMLLGGPYASLYTASHTTVDQVAGALSGSPLERLHEVYGFGWTQGGQALANHTITIVNTDDALYDADDISVSVSSAGDLGPSYAALIYDATNNYPLVFNDFGEAKTAGASTLMLLNFPNGVISLTYTP